MEDRSNKEKFEMVYHKMDAGGFHYCFKHYSNWEDIDDPIFHGLREIYLTVANSLEKYIIHKYNEEE